MTQTTTPQDKESRVSKATHTWLVKNYTHKLAHPDDKRNFNRAENCVKFITRFSPKNEKLTALESAATNYYYKNKNTIEHKLKRTKRSPKLKALIAKYPKLNIENGFKVAMLHDKFSLSQADIELFENILLASIKKPKPKE